MKDFRLSETGDIILNNFDISFISDESELAQSVSNILSIRSNEFVLEKDVGLSDENLLGKDYNEEYLKQDIAYAILHQEPRIASVESIAIGSDNRLLSICLSLLATNEKKIEVTINA